MTDNCTLLLVLSASEDARTNRHRCGFGALRCRWCVLHMCTCMHARARACTRASGVRVFGTRPTLASLPVYVYPLPSRRVVVTAQLYPQKPVFRLSHSPGNRERDWRRPSPYREKAKDLLLPPDEHRNRLEIGTAIRCFFPPPLFFFLFVLTAERVSFILQQGDSRTGQHRRALESLMLLAHLALSEGSLRPFYRIEENTYMASFSRLKNRYNPAAFDFRC